MVGPQTANAPSLGLPLRFVLTGLAAFVLAALWIPLYPEAFVDFYYQAHTLGFTHLITLGWITMIIMGAGYQLVPVAFETRLWSERLGRWQYWLMLAGVAGMIAHFWLGHWEGMADAAVLVVIAGLLFIVNIALSLRSVPVWNIVAWHVSAALAFLAGTLTLGVLMALDKLWNFFPGDVLSILHAHAHLAGVGWVTMMIFGVAYKLIPMFTISPIEGGRAGMVGFWLLVGGVAGLVASFLLANWLVPLFALAIAAAVGLFAWEMRRTLKARRRPALDWGVRHFLTALGVLGLLSALGVVLATGRLPEGAMTGRLMFAYGYLGLMGWASMTIVGMLYKIVPFLVWFHVYSDRVGLDPVPSLADLSSVRLQRVTYGLLAGGIAAMAGAILSGDAAIIRAASLVVAAGALTFAWNIGLVLRHLLELRRRARAAGAAKPAERSRSWLQRVRRTA